MKSKPEKTNDKKETKTKVLLKEKETKSKSKQDKNKESEKLKEEKSEEEENIIPIPKPFNIERYIYISTYTDVALMSNLKKLFEEINQKAFNFSSLREIYTYNLTEEEKDNNEIDYISGFQVTDRNIRITILEGITGKGMQKVKEILLKEKLNDEKVKILSNSSVLFDKRIYSKFDLSLKIIKLRHYLNKYLETYTIYENANRLREIYDCFQNLASILRVETMEEVSWYNIFPTAESLLQLERKHADMITHQDITGIYKELRKAKKISMNNLLSDNSNSHSNSNMTSVSNVNTNPIEVKKEDNKNNGKKSKKKIYVSKSQGDIYISGRNNTNRIELKKKAEEEYALYQEKLKNIHKMILKPKTITRNELYEKFLVQKKNKNVSKSQIWDNNLKYIDNLKERVPTYKKFCRPCKPGEEIIETPKQILFCPTKRNYFDSLVKIMREKYISDKKHFYSYSNYSLALSFPMIDTNRNEEYIKYLENKKKWKNGKDFERYKQPEREKIYFPKIQNIL